MKSQSIAINSKRLVFVLFSSLMSFFLSYSCKYVKMSLKCHMPGPWVALHHLHDHLEPLWSGFVVGAGWGWERQVVGGRICQDWSCAVFVLRRIGDDLYIFIHRSSSHYLLLFLFCGVFSFVYLSFFLFCENGKFGQFVMGKQSVRWFIPHASTL